MPSIKKRLRQNEFYCLCCQKRKIGQKIKLKNTRNSKVGNIPTLKGSCNSCGCKLSKFVKRSAAKELKKKY